MQVVRPTISAWALVVAVAVVVLGAVEAHAQMVPPEPKPPEQRPANVLYLVPVDEASLLVLDKLCSIIRAKKSAFSYDEVRLFLDPEDRLRQVAQNIAGRRERGGVAEKEASVLAQTLYGIPPSVSCLETAQEAAASAVKTEPPYDMIWVKVVGTAFYHMRVRATRRPQADAAKAPAAPEIDLKAQPWELLSDGRSGGSLARLLGWRTLPVNEEQNAAIEEPALAGDSPCYGADAGCYDLGTALALHFRLRGSNWIGARDLVWDVSVACNTDASETGWKEVLRKSFAGSTAATDSNADVGNEAANSHSVIVSMNLARAGNCRASIKAKSPFPNSAEVSKELAFSLRPRPLLVEWNKNRPVAQIFRGMPLVRATTMTLVLQERAVVLGLGDYGTNRDVLESDVRNSLLVIRGPEVQAFGTRFVEAIRAKKGHMFDSESRRLTTDLRETFEGLVAGAIDTVVQARGDLLGEDLFDTGEDGYSPIICENIGKSIAARADKEQLVSWIPSVWDETCLEAASSAIGEAAADRPPIFEIRALGAARSAIPLVAEESPNVVMSSEHFLADAVDRPFGREERYEVRALVPPAEDQPKDPAALAEWLGRSSRSAPMVWVIHQVAAPMNLEVALEGGPAVFLKDERTMSRFIPYHIRGYAAWGGGFAIALGIINDEWGLRLAPVWYVGADSVDATAPITLFHRGCFGQKERADPTSMGLRIDGEACEFWSTVEGGFDPASRSVVFGAGLESGLRFGDSLDVHLSARPHLSAGTVLIRPGGLPTLMASMLIGAEFRLLDPTAIVQ